MNSTAGSTGAGRIVVNGEDAAAAATTGDGLVAVVKRDCPTCELVAPVLGEIEARGGLTVFTQDDPAFPDTVTAPTRHHDGDLAFSWHRGIETVPTLLRLEGGVETGRIVGWSRAEWESFTGLESLGGGLPEHRPGCGSLSVDPALADTLAARFAGDGLSARRIEIGSLEDTHEAMFDRGWSDGLPLVPPTPERVLAMLAGTSRGPGEVVANVPPDLVDCTVEKAAVNAVMAGCRPEYLPVVLAALTAVCNDSFNMHGMLATTMAIGPAFIVNGPIAREIGMNSGINVHGQGNRANSTIGRAVQLIVRNVGGGRPGGVDRATMGQPGKIGFCFAEIEDPPDNPAGSARAVASSSEAGAAPTGSGIDSGTGSEAGAAGPTASGAVGAAGPGKADAVGPAMRAAVGAEAGAAGSSAAEPGLAALGAAASGSFADAGWVPLCTDFGFEAGANTVTAFGGEAPRSTVDQMSREPESLARSMAAALQAIHHPKLVQGFDAILAIAPDHLRVFVDSGWTRRQTTERINELTTRPVSELVRGAAGIAEGIPASAADAATEAELPGLPKFTSTGLHLVHCGGGAGLFSAVIGGWVNGATGTQPVCVAIDPWR